MGSKKILIRPKPSMEIADIYNRISDIFSDYPPINPSSFTVRKDGFFYASSIETCLFSRSSRGTNTINIPIINAANSDADNGTLPY